GYGLGTGAAFGNQTTGSLVISGPVSGKQTYRALYFGDNWHATSKLTLNLGLRYELQGPWSERFDRMTYFNPSDTNSSVTVSSATSPFFASVDQGLTPSSRLGPASPTDTNASNCTLSAPGFTNFTCATPGPFGTTLVPVPGRNPQPNVSLYGIAQQPLSATAYTRQQYGYVEQWNIGIQRELPGGFFADVAYAGSHGVHLEQFNTNVNQIPDHFIAQAAAQAAAGQPVTIAQPVTTYPFSVNLPGNLQPGKLIQGQLDRPFPQYSGLQFNGFGCCSSNYNSLQATVTRRFS